MLEQKIERYIKDTLPGEVQKLALDFTAYLRTNGMLFERGKDYWEDKLYFMTKYRDVYVCFILIGDSENTGSPWTIWSDISDSSDAQWYENTPVDRYTKKIAFQNVDFCGKCSPNELCYGGMRKTVFGTEFENVCRTTFRFNNPNVKTLECIKKLVDLRKDKICKN